MFQVYSKVIQIYICIYIYIWKLKLFSHVQLFVTPWTVAYQASLTMEFSRQEYWSGLPCPSPEVFLVQRMNPCLLDCRQTLYCLIYLGINHKHVADVQSLSCVWLFTIHGLQHSRLPCPSLSPRVCSNSCPLSQWYHPTISSSVVPFSSCPQSFLASGSFPMTRLFKSGGQSIGASASVLPVNIQGWFPLELTDLVFYMYILFRLFCSLSYYKILTTASCAT